MITLNLTVQNKLISIRPKLLTVNNAVCNESLQHMESTAECTLVWEPHIFAALITEAKIPAVIKDNDIPLFTGIIQTDVSWRDIGRPYPVEGVSVTINDNTVLLDKKTKSELALINTDVRTVVATVCEHCGITLSAEHGVLPTKAVQAFVADEGKSYKELLSDFLFSYGYSYYFDEHGKLCVFDFTTVDLEAVQTIDDTALIGEVQVQKSNKRYTGIKVGYNTLTEKKNELVYFSGNGYGGDGSYWHTLPETIMPGVYYPFESSPEIETIEGQVWQSFDSGFAETYKKYDGETDYRRSKKTSLLYTQNHHLVQDWTVGIVIDRTLFGAKRASVRLQNKGTEDAKVHQLSIRADAWYRNAEAAVTVGSDDNPYGYQSEFIYTAQDAEKLGKALSVYMLIGQYRLTTTSDTAFELGVIQKIDCGVSGFGIAALPYNSSYDAEKKQWITKWLSAAEPAVDVTRFKSLGHDDTAGALNAAAENAQKIQEITNGSDDVPPPDTPIKLKAVAQKEGILLSCVPVNGGLKNSVAKITWEIKKTTAGAWERTESTTATHVYRFNRGIDGYPEDATLAVWRVRAKVENIYGKQSVLWAGADTGIAVDTSEYGTWQLGEKGFSAEFYRDHIIFDLQAQNQNVYGNIKSQLYIGDRLIYTAANGLRYWYPFDRSIDAFPEIDTLKNQTYRITVSNESGNSTDILLKPHNMFFAEYRTWIFAAPALSAKATENTIRVQWSPFPIGVFGTPIYEIYLNDSLLATEYDNEYVYTFPAGVYPEKNDLANYIFTVKCKTEAHEKTTLECTPDTTDYKTWIISAPIVQAIAEEGSVAITWKPTGDSYGIKSYDVIIDGQTVESSLSSYMFLYTLTGYPEKTDIAALSIQIKASSRAHTVTSAAIHPDTATYKGYIPETPNGYYTVSGRSVSVKWQSQDVYGYTGAMVQVAKAYKIIDGSYTPITDENELIWYAPALGINPYESVENYKTGEPNGKLEIEGNSVTFTVPLYGQDSAPVNTQYAYRLAAKTVSKQSAWSEPYYIEVRATSAADIVKAWSLNDAGERVKIDGALGVQQIFVQELAALSANLGYITDGALQGDAYNYWAVNDTPLHDGTVMKRGSFRVGGAHQYIQVTPRINTNGQPTGEYDIEFVVGNFKVDTTGKTSIYGNTFQIFNSGGELMFSVSPEGNKIRVKEGYYRSTTPIFEGSDISLFGSYSNSFFFADNHYVLGIEAYDIEQNHSYKLRVVIIKNKTEKKILFNIEIDGPGSIYSIMYTLPDVYGRIRLYQGQENNTVSVYTYDCGTGQEETTQHSIPAHIPALQNGAVSFGTDLMFYDATQKNYILHCTNNTWTELQQPHNDLNNVNGDIAFDDPYLYRVYFGVYATVITRTHLTSGIIEYAALSGVFEALGSAPYNCMKKQDNSLMLLGHYKPRLTTQSYGDAIPCIIVLQDEHIQWSIDYTTVQFTVPHLYISDSSFARVRCIMSQSGFIGVTEKDTSPQRTLDRLSVYTPLALEPITHESYVAAGTIQTKVIYTNPTAEFLMPVAVAHTMRGENIKYVCHCVGKNTNYNSHLWFLRWYAHNETVITGAKTYGAGIGFESIVFDEASNNYRYLLDTGAHLEFNADGTLVGIKGDKGERGEQGERGPKGDKGATGERGPQGEQGVKGDKGEKGLKGDTGNVGPKGDKGATGERGPKGDKGEKGDRGYTGPKGDKGDPGTDIIIKILQNGYIQWPGMPTPEAAGLNFPGYRWAEVNYNGAFFRAKGNDALPFNGGEQRDAIRKLTGYASFHSGNRIHSSDGVFRHEYTGRGSSWVTRDSWDTQMLYFDSERVAPSASENRPRNRTIVIWRLQKI